MWGGLRGGHQRPQAARAAGKGVAEADAKGALKKITSSKAALGGRVVVVDSSGTAYVADSKGGRLVVIKP